ncbi:MAG: sortase [Anaerolineae bacterium]|nr:sortase [Anaerolineae bacterium]
MKALSPFFTLLIALAALNLSGCRPASEGLAQTALPDLPTPQARLDRQTTATALPSVAEPARTPLPAGKAELARSVYGGRVIEWVRIPKIAVFAPVTAVGWEAATLSPFDTLGPRSVPPLFGGKAKFAGTAPVWDSPHAQVGWALSSALPGDEGNIVLYGHNNIDSSVFRNLSDLKFGDEVRLQTGEREWLYYVTEVNILPVQSEEEDREVYAEYMSPTRAPRLTLISCWPPTNNTHRVIVVAYPAEMLP